jgi:transcriptional regulator with XRE-family HTH domain
MARRKLTFEVLIRTAFQGAISKKEATKKEPKPSKAELGRRLGVSAKTVSRWLADESKPDPKTMQRIEQSLHKEYKRVSSEAKRINRHFDARPPEMAIPIVGERRMLKERDSMGRDTGREVPSDWVNYDVRTYDVQTIFDLMRGLRDKRAIIQLIYKIPRGGTSLGGKEYKGGGRSTTEIIRLNRSWGDAELWENTIGPLQDNRLTLLYVGVIDL